MRFQIIPSTNPKQLYFVLGNALKAVSGIFYLGHVDILQL